MRIFFISLLISLPLASGFAADDDSASTPPNQNNVQVDRTPPKAGVTSVQSQSAGPPSSQGSLDPSRQSSMGLGIQIPFHKEKDPPPASETKPANGDSSQQ